MEPELFSPTIRAALPDIGTELTRKLDELDPSSDTNVVLLIVSNGEVTFQSTLSNEAARAVMVETCAWIAADGENPPLTPEGEPL